jgi:SAM-dependent methyltransferase
VSTAPAWLSDVLGADLPADGEEFSVLGRSFVMLRGIPRQLDLVSDAQAQTADTFGYKWNRRATFESETFRGRARTWLVDRYGAVADADWWSEYGPEPLVLDAGCGAGFSALELFGDRLRQVRYLGVDISSAVDVAAERFGSRGVGAGFVQADMVHLPFESPIASVVFSEGALHHSDSTRRALHAVSRLLVPGGRILFYVYRRKGPVREFTDDYIRDELQEVEQDEAWDLLMPLTKLGRQLGELDVTVDIEEPVELLGIPAGKIPLQRLFYWHVCKMYFDPTLELDELNHINFDWFAPSNAHRQTPEEVREWCAESGLDVERERVEEAGITIVARRAS